MTEFNYELHTGFSKPIWDWSDMLESKKSSDNGYKQELEVLND